MLWPSGQMNSFPLKILPLTLVYCSMRPVFSNALTIEVVISTWLCMLGCVELWLILSYLSLTGVYTPLLTIPHGVGFEYWLVKSITMIITVCLVSKGSLGSWASLLVGSIVRHCWPYASIPWQLNMEFLLWWPTIVIGIILSGCKGPELINWSRCWHWRDITMWILIW